MHGWKAIDVDRILAQNAVLYDSSDPQVRAEVDLAELPLVEDGTQQEVNVFNAEGRRVPRRAAVYHPSTSFCGLLANLSTVATLFDDEHLGNLAEYPNPPDNDPNDPSGPSLNVYPQGFLLNKGHFQAKRVPSSFIPFIRRAHQQLAIPVEDEDHIVEDGEDELDYMDKNIPLHSRHRAVVPISTQGYNELMHAVRNPASGHDIQHGDVSAALTGCFALTPATQRRAKECVQRCNSGLPHERFSSTISNDNIPTAFRLENLYLVNMKAIDPAKRTGRQVATICLFFANG